MIEPKSVTNDKMQNINCFGIFFRKEYYRILAVGIELGKLFTSVAAKVVALPHFHIIWTFAFSLFCTFPIGTLLTIQWWMPRFSFSNMLLSHCCRRIWRLLHNEASWWKVIFVDYLNFATLLGCCKILDILTALSLPLSPNYFHFLSKTLSRSSIDAKLDYIIQQLAAEKA